jgi:UDP-N-acetylmuramate dehydrogenase
VFKRPEGYYAGKLIQDAGLQGWRIGGAQVSDKHCGFIVNTGDATASDIIALIQYVKDRVFQNSGVMLEEEVKILGG